MTKTKELREKIEEIIITEFRDSKHAVVEEKNMTAIVKTDYQSMASEVADQIMSELDQELKRQKAELIKKIDKKFRGLTNSKYSLFDGRYEQAMEFLEYLDSLQRKG